MYNTNTICLRFFGLLLVGVGSLAFLSGCASANPPDSPVCTENALGVSRTLEINTESAPIHDLLEHKEVVLTFDDGPSPDRTVRVMNALASECVTATFFLRGDQAKRYPGIVRKIVARGHQLGGHTYSHRRLTELPIEDAQTEILRGIDMIEKADTRAGMKLTIGFFRYPFLISSPELDAYLIDNNLVRTDVSADSRDWSGIDGDEIIENVMLDLVAHDEKGIILLHDPMWATSHTVGRLLERLKTDGYRVVALQPAAKETPS